MLPSHSSTDSNMRKGTKRKRATQTACSRVESVKPSIVLGRLDGLAIPWWQQRQPKPTWKISRYSLACAGSALKRSGNWACESISKPMRFVIQQLAVRPGPSWTQSWGKRTCTSICRSPEKCSPTLLCRICTPCYTTTCSRKHMRKGAQKHRTTNQPAQARHNSMSAPKACWKCTQNSWKGMRRKHAEWLRDACAAYRLSKSRQGELSVCHIQNLRHNEQGAWSQFLHEKDLEDMWLPM